MLFGRHHLTFLLIDCLLEVLMEILDLNTFFYNNFLQSIFCLNLLWIYDLPLNNINNGNNTTVHFCSYDQSATGNFLSELAKQHLKLIISLLNIF